MFTFLRVNRKGLFWTSLCCLKESTVAHTSLVCNPTQHSCAEVYFSTLPWQEAIGVKISFGIFHRCFARKRTCSCGFITQRWWQLQYHAVSVHNRKKYLFHKQAKIERVFCLVFKKKACPVEDCLLWHAERAFVSSIHNVWLKKLGNKTVGLWIRWTVHHDVFPEETDGEEPYPYGQTKMASTWQSLRKKKSFKMLQVPSVLDTNHNRVRDKPKSTYRWV